MGGENGGLLEEKLYFKPASYGKGIKKEEKRKNHEKDHRIRNLIALLSFVVVIILIILWLLRGKTTISGQYPADITTTSLECATNNRHYEKIGSSRTDRETIKLTVVFRSDGTLSTIGLRDRLEFNSAAEASNAEAVAHAMLGTTLAKEGLKFTEFENKFTLLDNILEVSLHAVASDITEYTANYFLIDSNGQLPQTLDEYRNNYESQGFICDSTAKNNQ